MGEDRRIRGPTRVAVLAWAVLIGLGTSDHAMVLAQVGSLGTGGVSLQPPPVETGRPNSFVPGRAEGALPVGDWLLYPTGFAGALYDTNINQTTANEKSGIGLRLVPSMLAVNDDGLHRTTLYGTADARLYANNQANSSANATAARIGAIEYFQPAPDWTLNGQVDYTRQQDLFSSFGIDHSVSTLNPTGIGLAPTANPASYNQFSALGSVQKNFAEAFAILGGSVVGQVYDNIPTGAPSPNGIVYTATGRGGYWVVPSIYSYLEGSVDRRDYSTSVLSSSGYRVVGGLGSDRIGLFRGEIYGGFQSESYNSGAIGTTSGSVFGARGYYYPLPELTLSLAGDRTLGASLLQGTATSPIGSSTAVTSLLAEARYALAPEWSASARGGYIHTDFVRAGRSDDAWTIGPTVTYSVWQNFGITLDYQHVALASNAAGAGFSRDVVTLGVTYKY